MKLQQNYPLAVAAALLLTLSACSGGSDDPANNTGGTDGTGETGGTGNSAPLDITSANARDVAGFATAFLDFGMDSSGMAAQAKSGSGSSSSRQARAALTNSCTHGGTETFDFGDGDSQIEIGDYFSMSENSCAEQEFDEAGQPYIATTSSSMRLDISAVNGENDLSFTLSMSESTITDNGHSSSMQGSGSMSFSLDGNGGQQAAGNMQISATMDGETINFDPINYNFSQTGNQYSYDYSMTASGSGINGSMTAATNPPFTGTVDGGGDTGAPTAGILTITGGNSSIILDAGTGNPDTVLMTINENGTITSEEIDWDDLGDPDPLI